MMIKPFRKIPEILCTIIVILLAVLIAPSTLFARDNLLDVMADELKREMSELRKRRRTL